MAELKIKDPFEGIVDPFSGGGPDVGSMAGSDEPPKLVPRYAGLEQEAATMGPLKRGLIGVGQGMTEAGRGAQQVYYGLTGQKDRLADVTQQGMDERAMLAPLGTAGTVGSVIGQSAPYTLMPGGVAGNALRRAGTAGLSGAVQGGLGFVPEGGSRGMNALLGSAGGAAGSGLMSGISKLIRAPGTQLPPDPHGIPRTLSETTSGVPSRTDVLMERAPGVFGTKAFRERQHDAANNAAKTFLSKYIANPGAQDVVEGNRAFVRGLYEGVKDLVAQVPQYINPSNTRKTALELLDRYPDTFKKLQDTKVQKVLEDIQAGTYPIKATRTFDELWELRQGLGDLMGQAKKLEVRGDLNRKQYDQIRKLWSSVTEDLDNWAGSIGRPDIMQKFRSANEAYKTFVVKHHAIQQAYDKTIQEVGDKTLFSPKKFSTNLRKIIEKDKVMKSFTPMEIQEMTGLANVMNVVQRAGQHMENPPTGNRWGALTAGGAAEAALFKAGGVSAMLKGTAFAGLTAGAIKFLTTTAPGKKLALAASKLEPDSPGLKMIVNSVMRQAPKYAAGAATEYNKPTSGVAEEAILSAPNIKDMSDDELRKSLESKYGVQ